MSHPMFSVVMPSYNHAEYLQRSVDSVLSQRIPGAPSFELLVIDGGSTDGTIDILRSYGDALSWTSERDRGQTHALNKGLDRARGEIIAWLNSDDLLCPGALAHVAEQFRLNPDGMWLIGHCDIVNQNDEPIRAAITNYKHRRLRDWSYDRLVVDNFISQPAVFLRREIFKEVGLFDESRQLDMDYEFWLRIGRRFPPILTDRLLAHFRMYDTSKSGGQYIQGLRQAHETSRRYARLIGKPWLGWINYWYYYRGASAVYGAMSIVRRCRRVLRRRAPLG